MKKLKGTWNQFFVRVARCNFIDIWRESYQLPGANELSREWKFHDKVFSRLLLLEIGCYFWLCRVRRWLVRFVLWLNTCLRLSVKLGHNCTDYVYLSNKNIIYHIFSICVFWHNLQLNFCLPLWGNWGMRLIRYINGVWDGDFKGTAYYTTVPKLELPPSTELLLWCRVPIIVKLQPLPHLKFW